MTKIVGTPNNKIFESNTATTAKICNCQIKEECPLYEKCCIWGHNTTKRFIMGMEKRDTTRINRVCSMEDIKSADKSNCTKILEILGTDHVFKGKISRCN